jgi:uncharacterized membrane protein
LADKTHETVSDEKKLATDRKYVQFLLRTGLVIATLLMAVGVAMKASAGEWSTPDVRLFDLFRSSGISSGDRVMATGILVLAATPAFRVIALLLLWIRERDWKFVAVAAIVMVTLGLAIAMGGG